MFDRADALRVIEDALDQQPFCAVCGQPTSVRDVDGVLFLSCPALTHDGGILSRLSAAILAHTDRGVIDLREPTAA